MAETDLIGPEQIIERLCALQEKVGAEALGYDHAADCFCGKGGFWRDDVPPRYDALGGVPDWPAAPDWWRNDLKVIEFIEEAVAEKLARTRPHWTTKLFGSSGRGHLGDLDAVARPPMVSGVRPRPRERLQPSR